MNCKDITKAEAKFIFEINMSDWLQALILPYRYTNFQGKMLYTEKNWQHPTKHKTLFAKSRQETKTSQLLKLACIITWLPIVYTIPTA